MNRLREWRDALPRPGLVGLTLRAAVFVTGLVALLLPVPTARLGTGVVVLGLGAVALVAAVAPGSAWVGVVEYGAVTVWMVATLVWREPVVVPVALGLAGALYLHHVTAALAAVLPVDAEVDPRVLTTWVWRTAGVLAVSVPAGVGVVTLPDLLGTSRSVLAPLSALTATALVVLTLVLLARPRR